MDEQLEALYRAKWTQSARDEHKKNGGYFAGPDETFPLKDASDVEDAWDLAGHADNPDEVRRNIISWARENGHTDALPESAKEPTSKQERVTPALPQNALLMHFPIIRTDPKEWLIEGQATSEQIDSYSTIFDYESSKKAFQKWRGNIREMHQNKAVGRAIDIDYDDSNKSIFLRARISKGARDTWEKILDGTLQGFSIGIPPGKYKTRNVTRNGKTVPEYYDHELGEVSVVDNPGSPGCNIAIVRADGLTTETLDTTEEEPANTPSEPSSSSLALDRAGARLSEDSRAALHEMRDKAMALCGCDECQGMCAEPDGDEDMERSITAIVERVVTSQMSIIYTRLQGIAGTLARSAPHNAEQLDAEAITRAVSSSLTEVRAELSAVKEQVDRIAETPVPGAPVMNMTRSAPSIDKRLATDPSQSSPSQGALYDAMRTQFEQNARVGTYANNPQQQFDDMARVLASQPPLTRR